jgi:peptidoglycan biosynthesis protein MviN/MurJ (putative lipid II flippase)
MKILSARAQGLFKSIAKSTVAQATGRFANTLIPFVILNTYEPSELTDNFFFVFSLAFIFWGTIPNSITDASIPTLIQDKKILKEKQRNIFAILVASISVILLSACGIIIDRNILSFPLLVGVFLSAYSSNIASFNVAYLNVNNIYASPGVLWGLRLIPLLLFWVVSPEIKYLPWLMVGVGAADLSRAIVINIIANSDYSRMTRIGLNEALKGFSYVAISSIVVGINPVVDRFIAGLGSPGDLSLLELGERLYGVIGSLSTIGIMSVVLVELSGKVSNIKNSHYFERVLLVFSGWSVIWLCLSYIVWSLLEVKVFSYLEMTSSQYQKVILIFFYYLSGLPAFIVGIVCVRGFLAIGKAQVVAALSVVSVLLNVVLSFALNSIFGVCGIALATSIVMAVMTIILILLFFGKFNE